MFFVNVLNRFPIARATRRRPATTTRLIAAGMAGLWLAACAKPAATPPPIDATKFTAVRQAASAVPHHNAPNATREGLVNATKNFSAVMIAMKDVPLTPNEQPVSKAYREALEAYRFAVDLMAERDRRKASTAGGNRVPVQIGTMKFDSLIAGAQQYGLPLLDETLPDGVALKVLPSDAPERVWAAADAAQIAAEAALTR